MIFKVPSNPNHSMVLRTIIYPWHCPYLQKPPVLSLSSSTTSCGSSGTPRRGTLSAQLSTELLKQVMQYLTGTPSTPLAILYGMNGWMQVRGTGVYLYGLDLTYPWH